MNNSYLYTFNNWIIEKFYERCLIHFFLLYSSGIFFEITRSMNYYLVKYNLHCISYSIEYNTKSTLSF